MYACMHETLNLTQSCYFDDLTFCLLILTSCQYLISPYILLLFLTSPFLTLPPSIIAPHLAQVHLISTLFPLTSSCIITPHLNSFHLCCGHEGRGPGYCVSPEKPLSTPLQLTAFHFVQKPICHYFTWTLYSTSFGQQHCRNIRDGLPFVLVHLYDH